MCDPSLDGMHIRPKEEFISEFYNKCDNFQKLIMNRKSTPLYKAVFSVLKENEYGFYRDFETFVFPTTFGGYNIIANDYGFSDYTKRLADIGEFYDNRVSDNIYRSMTHEAIKILTGHTQKNTLKVMKKNMFWRSEDTEGFKSHRKRIR